MNDRELKQLFEAKRTSLDNQQRQQQMAATIEARKQKHRLWPLWAGSIAAAASAALILMVRPADHTVIDNTHIQLAQAAAPTLPEESAPIATRQHLIKPTNPIMTSTTTIPADTIIPVLAPIRNIDTVATIDSTPNVSPTIHRRRTTHLIQQEIPRRENILQILAEHINFDTINIPQTKSINIKTSTI